MIQLRKFLRSVPLWTIALGFLVSVALLILYVLHFGQSDFSSDDAVLNLQAELVWKQGRLFPEGWVGNNGDLMMPSGVILIAPLLAWFPNGYGLHAVASVFSVMLLLGTFTAFLVKGKVPLPIALAAAAFLASGVSYWSALMLYLQTTYVWWPAAFLLGATLIWRAHESRSSGTPPSKRYAVSLAAVTFAIALSNPGRALLMVVFPLYVFERTLALRMRSPRSGNESWSLAQAGVFEPLALFGLGGGFLLAGLLYVGLFRFGVVQTMHNASALHWEGWEAAKRHWDIFQTGWFSYLGGSNEINASGGALEHVLQSLRRAFSYWLTWVGVAEAIRMFRRREPLRGALAAAFLAAFVPTLVMYVLLSPLATDTASLRYFSVPIILLLALGAFRVAGAASWLRWVGYPLSIAFSVFVVLVCAFRFIPAASKESTAFLERRDSYTFRVTKFLERNGLRWGYATWWNAGVITILSSEAVRVNPILFSGTEIVGFPYMIQQDNLLPQAYEGETFLMLGQSEENTERTFAMEAKFGKPSRILRSQDVIVYAYPTNISSKFCGVGYQMNSKLKPGEQVGRVLSVARDSRAQELGINAISVVVENNAAKVLSGSGRYPVAIGIQLLDETGAFLEQDWLHYPLPCEVGPGESRAFFIRLPALPRASRMGKVGLLQEGVAWFEQWGVEPVQFPMDGSETDRISSRDMESTQ